ncbi:MAG: uracil-DNA glycosylase family protein [Flavobacteriales bacterium]
MKELTSQIADCKVCEAHLPHAPNPVISVHPKSKIVIIGQAPGKAVHETNIPWNDKSGNNLRVWMNLTKEEFYDESFISIIPMGFCYPGTGKSGDLPPRKECAKLWHKPLFDELEQVELILLIGKYAQDYYLKKRIKKNLTETVKNFQAYLPKYFVLPHPSPRNNIWMKKNDWFKHLVLPELKTEIERLKKSRNLEK